MDADSAIDRAEQRRRIGELRTAIEDLLAATPEASHAVSEGARVLVTRLDSLLEEQVRHDRKVRLADQLTTAVGSLERAGDVLDAYIAEFDGEARATDFAQVRRTLWPRLEAIAVWNAAAETWSQYSPLTMGQERARQIIEERDRLAPEVRELCVAEGDASAWDYVESVANRRDIAGFSILQPLRTNFLSNPYVVG
ncbi:MAG: hypothetical protein KDA71_25875, partial [Planctomycetales bacterium]|nr:hypothetical protein [Planctomycetales bacterium]